MKKLNKNNKGFSLVELLVVIAIMVVLVGVIAPSLLRNIEKSRVSRDVQNLDNIAAAIQASLMVEAANDDAPTDAVYEYSKLWDDADSTFKALKFTAEFKDNLPSGKNIEMTSKAGKTGKIYFTITSKGAITVFVSTDADVANTVKDGDTAFSVTR